MPYRSLRRRSLAVAATSVLAALGVASAASAAATVTVTGDDGNPVGLNAGPVTIRNMNPTVGIAFADTNGQFSAHVAGPDGARSPTTLTCLINGNFTRYLTFRGNGTYTVTVTNYASSGPTRTARGRRRPRPTPSRSTPRSRSRRRPARS